MFRSAVLALLTAILALAQPRTPVFDVASIRPSPP